MISPFSNLLIAYLMNNSLLEFCKNEINTRIFIAMIMLASKNK